MRLKQGSSGLPKQTSTSPAIFDPIFTHTCRDTGGTRFQALREAGTARQVASPRITLGS